MKPHNIRNKVLDNINNTIGVRKSTIISSFIVDILYINERYDRNYILSLLILLT